MVTCGSIAKQKFDLDFHVPNVGNRQVMASAVDAPIR